MTATLMAIAVAVTTISPGDAPDADSRSHCPCPVEAEPTATSRPDGVAVAMWTTLGGGLVAATLTAVFGGTTLRRRRRFESLQEDFNEGVLDESGVADTWKTEAEFYRYRRATNISAGVTAALLSSAAVLAVVRARRSRADRAASLSASGLAFRF